MLIHFFNQLPDLCKESPDIYIYMYTLNMQIYNIGKII